MKQSGKKYRGWIGTAVAAAVLVIACGVYLGSYYAADDASIAAFAQNAVVRAEIQSSGDIVYKPSNAKVGLIFYPGGKVDHGAYQPLMQALAEEGVLCVLTEMPFRLAVLDINAADGVQAMYPEVERWYIGGHSLGGSMAASYLGAHSDEFDGLILLGSYSTEDLSDKSLKVLSVYGSEDGVLNREKYRANLKNLPEDYREVVIEGGCHAYFGMYGAQDGDGMPSITAQEQTRITAEEILKTIKQQ